MLRHLKVVLIASLVLGCAVAYAQQSPLDTVIPEVNFDQVPLQNALAYLVGDLKIHLDIDPRLSTIPVTLSRSNQTLRSILQEIAQLVNAEFTYDEKTNTVHFRFKPFDRIRLNFLNVYDGVLLFGGSIISPLQGAMLAISSGGMGWGGFGGWGGWGGLGGWGGWGGGWGGWGGWGGGLGGWGGWGGGWGGWGGGTRGWGGGGWGGGTRGWGGGGWGGGTIGAGRRTRGAGRGRGGGW